MATGSLVRRASTTASAPITTNSTISPEAASAGRGAHAAQAGQHHREGAGEAHQAGDDPGRDRLPVAGPHAEVSRYRIQSRAWLASIAV